MGATETKSATSLLHGLVDCQSASIKNKIQLSFFFSYLFRFVKNGVPIRLDNIEEASQKKISQSIQQQQCLIGFPIFSFPEKRENF